MTAAASWACLLLSVSAFPLPTLAQQQRSSASPTEASTQDQTFNAERAIEDALKKQRASLETQRQAIHRQLKEREDTPEQAAYLVEQFIVPFPSAAQFNCPPLTASKVSELVSAAARRQALDPAILRAVIKQESAFRPCAVSIKGAQGLMQLMPATARELHVTNVFDPSQNVQAGAAYLKQLLGRYKGDLRLALVGYNAGPGRADQATDSAYPLETQNYVANILKDLGIDPPTDPPVHEDAATSSPQTEEQMSQISGSGGVPASPAVAADKQKSAEPKP